MGDNGKVSIPNKIGLSSLRFVARHALCVSYGTCVQESEPLDNLSMDSSQNTRRYTEPIVGCFDKSSALRRLSVWETIISVGVPAPGFRGYHVSSLDLQHRGTCTSELEIDKVYLIKFILSPTTVIITCTVTEVSTLK